MSYPCPCCGYLTRNEEQHGTFGICPVCYWEDDDLQYNNPDFQGGANIESLNEARVNFKKCGACGPKYVNDVRKPLIDEIPFNKKGKRDQ
ncbi:CPCC family cysteine-rich protein [Marininema halotolerans]|uniref:Cysteine-rich CPCC n=1 Tax=Marininema halotolerans TaxID=1155944 RepID=A0A1I6PZT0_9BACL|nr:CPCC family cysteine-rich protein [Marininema halotolerans]SFS45580.1 Cysteine-rich CPCC [Marininema halotolerans]